MFKTYVGPVEDEGSVAYLRPETAQGHFVNFLNVLQTSRKRPPFGIAQIGKSFRNEITPGQLRVPDPGVRADGARVLRAARRGGRSGSTTGATSGSSGTSTSASPRDMLRLRPHAKEELSHYSAGTSDVEFLFPWGWGELEGIANRTDYDLKAHSRGERARSSSTSTRPPASATRRT